MTHALAGGLAEASPDAMICADTDGLITYWNEAAARMFGISREGAIGASLDLIVPEPMRGAHTAGMKRLTRGGEARVVGRVVEVVAQHVDGRTFPIEMSLAMWRDADQPVFGAVIRDVSVRRQNEDRLHHLAHFDQLTLLPNRTLFLERLGTVLGDGIAATVLVVDLDRFKEVNDHLGHHAGDEVLREAGLRLRQSVTSLDATVARLGGDEFAVLLPNTADPFIAAYTADAILDALNRPFSVEGRELKIGCSIGMAFAPADGRTADELTGSADLALYKAKTGGGDRSELFAPTMRHRAVARRRLEAELESAIARHELEVFYQPQIGLRGGAMTGAEALLRWRHPERGLVAPSAFIAVLERMKQAELVGQWVLETACRQAADWQGVHPSFRIGVNLFEAQVRSPGLLANVDRALAFSGLEPDRLELEITENVLLNDEDAWVSPMRKLRAKGVSLAFDDYGTGYASLSLLKRFPLSRLKIDRSFVRDLVTDPDDRAIVDAILSLGRSFNLAVTAEGVETREQEALLLGCGCEEAQGYLYGKPMSAADFTSLLGGEASCCGRLLAAV